MRCVRDQNPHVLGMIIQLYRKRQNLFLKQDREYDWEGWQLKQEKDETLYKAGGSWSYDAAQECPSGVQITKSIQKEPEDTVEEMSSH